MDLHRKEACLFYEHIIQLHRNILKLLMLWENNGASYVLQLESYILFVYSQLDDSIPIFVELILKYSVSVFVLYNLCRKMSHSLQHESMCFFMIYVLFTKIFIKALS